MKEFIHWYFTRIPYAVRGIWYAFTNDRSFRWQVFIGGSGIILLCLFAWPISKFEAILIISATVLTLITEIQNTAIETALDFLHPNQNEAIGKSKDMIAGSVLLSLIYAFSVVIFVLFF